MRTCRPVQERAELLVELFDEDVADVLLKTPCMKSITISFGIKPIMLITKENAFPNEVLVLEMLESPLLGRLLQSFNVVNFVISNSFPIDTVNQSKHEDEFIHVKGQLVAGFDEA